jgi:hypothetical protein
MKVSPFRLKTIALSLMLISAGCSSAPSSCQKNQASVAAPAPVIIHPRAIPEKVALTENLEISQPIEVYADIKSFNSNLDQVKLRLSFSPETQQNLRFFKTPVEVSMKKVNGSTWKAELGNNELKKLGINGETLKYEGHILAQNDKGQVTISKDPIELIIQTPPVDEEVKS